MASHTASDMRMAAEVIAKAARKLGLEPSDLGTPTPPVEIDEGEGEPLHEPELPARVARPAAAAPFDVEQPRPRRPPAPADPGPDGAAAPFDGERESAVANAA
jgi:hypothetical protein